MRGRAAITDGHGGLKLAEIEVDAPDRGEVRVRLRAAGLCRTDRDALEWGYPQVLGHEGAGTVIDVGPGVDALVPGDAVVLNWAVPCGRCRRCAAGHAALCDRTQGSDGSQVLGHHSSHAHAGGTAHSGRSIDRMFTLGTIAEVTLVRAEAASKMPAGIDFAHACILGCSVLTGVGAVVNVARVKPGDTVVVIGCGGVGLSVVQGARIAGATRIIAVDRDAERLALGRALGATDALRCGDGEALLDAEVATVLALTGGGADHAFEATGVPSLAFVALRCVRNGGGALQLSGPVAAADARLDPAWFAWNKRYVMPLYGDCVPQRDLQMLFECAARGTLDLASLITRRYRFDQAAEAFDDLRAGKLVKAVFDFD